MNKTFADFNIPLNGSNGAEQKTTCPECSHKRKPGNQKIKCLSVNVDKGLWNCHNCAWSGRLPGKDKHYERREAVKLYAKPKFKYHGLDPIGKKFMANRGITDRVLERNKITSKKGTIQFPYLKGGDVVNIKHRTQEKDFYQETGAEKIFYGYDDIPDSLGGTQEATLIIVEGEIDRLSLEVAGFQNCVSVPDGAPNPDGKEFASKFSFMTDDATTQKLKDVTRFILAVDNDAPGKKLESELARRLGPEKCVRVEWPEGNKDANDVLVRMGVEALHESLEFTTPYPIAGLYEPKDLALLNLYDHGMKPGVDIGWMATQKFYCLSEDTGDLHILTGIPGHGKSEWLDAVLVNLADSEGWNFGVFSPENLPLEQHAAKIIEKKLGLPFRDGFSGQRMTRDQVKSAQAWLDAHFSFILPPEKETTIEGILELARKLVFQKGIRGLVIDPWNEIDHARPSAMSETEYISDSLSRIRRFARTYQVHVWVVAHPTKLHKDKDSGKVPVPTPYDISGSAHWRNKADFCLTVYRNMDPKLDSKEVEIHIQKVRRKHLGRLGVAKLVYEYSTGKYLDPR